MFRMLRIALIVIVATVFTAVLNLPVMYAAEGCGVKYTITNFNHVDFEFVGLPDGWKTLAFGDGESTQFEVINGTGVSTHDYPYPGGDFSISVDGYPECDEGFTISWDVPTGGGGHRAGQVRMPPSVDNALLAIPDWFVPGHDYQLWGLRGAFLTVKDGTLGFDNVRQDTLFPGQELTIYDATTGEKHVLVVNDPWSPDKWSRFCLPGTTQTVVVSEAGYCAVIPLS